MTRVFHSIPPDVSIGKAETIMHKKGIDLLAVEENQEFLGIVSTYECKYFREAIERDGIHGPDETLRLKHHKVSEIMNTKLVRLRPSDSCQLASDIMKSIIFQVIPIVENKKLIGILSPKGIKDCNGLVKEKMVS